MNESKLPDALRSLGLLVLAAASALAPRAGLAEPPQPRSRFHEPVYRVASNQPVAQVANNAPLTQPAADVAPAPVSAEAQTAQTAQTAQPKAAPVHPLIPVLDFAKAGLAEIDKNIQDYSCTMVKRERIDGRLGDHEYMFLKVRHQPFSVYMFFLGPAAIKGRECIYVEGGNNGKLIAHEGKGFKAQLGTFHLDPNGLIAMRGQRYPITEVGLRNLTARLIEVGELDTRYGECEVKWFKDTKVANRKCTCIQVIHPTPRKEFRFHLARVFIDDELKVPIRFVSYQWPARPGSPPLLDEEYTYLNIKTGNGFTDADFEERNPNYKFQ